MGEEAGLIVRVGYHPEAPDTIWNSPWAELARTVITTPGEWVSGRRTGAGDTLGMLRKQIPNVERLCIQEMIRTGVRGELEVKVGRDPVGVAWLYARLIPAEISAGDRV